MNVLHYNRRKLLHISVTFCAHLQEGIFLKYI